MEGSEYIEAIRRLGALRILEAFGRLDSLEFLGMLGFVISYITPTFFSGYCLATADVTRFSYT